MERNLGHADNLCYTAQRLRVAVAQVVHHHGGVTGFVKFYQCVGADKSGSAGD